MGIYEDTNKSLGKENEKIQALATPSKVLNLRGAILAIGYKGIIKIYQYNDGDMVSRQNITKENNEINCIDFSENADYMAVGSHSNRVLIFKNSINEKTALL